jgi:ATP-binding cassette, subfamily F, member 3
MSLLSLQRVSLAFVGREIFHEISFQVENGDRVGLVGPNGSGKTTLLRILMGEISPDQGEVRISKGTRIGYLPQDAQEKWSGTLLRSVLDSVPDRLELADELRRVEGDLRNVHGEEEQMRLAQRLAEVHQAVERQELQYPPHEAEKILLGLGFETADFLKPVPTLSGGWKTRAALAGLLYQKPDLLLLDEPTNHLDIPSVRWLEQFLRTYKGAIVMVSHDRDFLNRQIGRVVSFEPEGMKCYTGNYDFYIQAREEGKKSLEAQARNQEQKIREAQKFIDRFRSKASKARQAQSKIKLVEKMGLVETRRKEKTIHFSFPDVPPSGRVVVTLEDLSKGFGSKTLYEQVNLMVFRGERVAIVGPNGCGKTTLLRMVAGELKPDRGTTSLGHGVTMSYFAQHHSDMLNPGSSILEEVYRVVPNESISYVRGVCGAFLFPGADVEKRISVLSGGEKARVCLAKLLVNPGNLMVMDEPTNHLDLVSSETLIDALKEYSGTLLFVSHNQSFINRLATKIWDLGEGRVMEYPGSLDEYYAHLARKERSLEGEREKSGDEPLSREPRGEGTAREDRKAAKRAEAERRRLIHDTLKPVTQRLEQLEEEIAKMELRQGELETWLADPEVFKEQEKSVPLLREYREVKEKLGRSLEDWEECQGRLENAKKELGV